MLLNIPIIAGLALGAVLASSVGVVSSFSMDRARDSLIAARGAFAYADDDYTMVVFSSAPIDAPAMFRDGRLGSFALVEHQSANKATVVKLMIDGKGQMSCFNVMADPDSGNRCGDFKDSLRLTKRDPGRVAGALDWSGEGESLKLAFDLPVSGSAK